ncbi:hypothetical protein [Roseiarcus sp.]
MKTLDSDAWIQVEESKSKQSKAQIQGKTPFIQAMESGVSA